MPIRESSYGYWSGNGAFVIVAAAAAIGIGNVTRLPWLAYTHGGGVFLACYVLAVFALGWPLMLSELSIGRWARQSVVRGFERASLASGGRKLWHAIGWMMLLNAVLVLSYTSVIAGWSFAFVMRGAAGSVQSQTPMALQEIFHFLARDPERSLAWHTLFMVMTCIIVSHGMRDGLERGARYLLALASLCLLGLLWFVVDTGDPALTARHLFAPKPEDFGWQGFIEAVQQAFFTVTVGFAAMYALGSYVQASAPLAALTSRILIIATTFSLLGSFAVTGLLTLGGAVPVPGLSLIFQAVPAALPVGWSGILPAVLFYGMLVCVALATAIVLLEALTMHTMEHLRTTRVFAATGGAALIWFIGLGSLLSFNVFADYELLGRTWFGWIQWLTVKLMAPLTVLMLSVFVTRVMPRGLRDEVLGSSGVLVRKLFQWLMRYPVRLLMIMLLMYGLGLIQALVELWS